MKKETLYWILQSAGWLSYFLVFTVTGIAALPENEQVSVNEILVILSESIYFFIVTHTLRSFIIRWGWLKLNLVRLIPRIALSTITIGLMIYMLRIASAYALGVFNAELYDPTRIFGVTVANIFIAAVWISLYFLYHYFERFNITLKYEAAMNEMLLNQLKAQLNPHFIFNALNSIRALVDEDPEKSKKSITRLSNILRTSLVTDKKRLTSFEEELRIVKDYLELESIRYEERLKVRFEIDPLSKKFMIPPMMIQTLVENGIKHGISRLKEGGQLEIKTWVEGAVLMIQIRNSGHFLNGKPKTGHGYGLKNTVERLNLLYGEEAQFSIGNENRNTVLTEIKIPQSF